MAALTAKARTAQRILALAPAEQKTKALKRAAQIIIEATNSILDANARDITAAKAAGLSDAMIDRLTLDASRIAAIAEALRAIADLEDPVGRRLAEWTRPNGLIINRVATPIGVVGVIYESRPNVTVDAGALCLKSGNAVILRGGSDSLHSSQALHAAMVQGIEAVGLPRDCVQLVDSPDRALVGAMLRAQGAIDVVIPRGGRSLVERVQTESKVPVFAHLEGICHVYVHSEADMDKARDIIVNAKMRRPGICGAAETLLIDRRAQRHVADLLAPLVEAGCELRGDDDICAAIAAAKPAHETDWSTEYLAPILSVKCVAGIDAALDHIATYGSGHTESIITEDSEAADAFFKGCDSAIVMHNASTQFADGGEFGMGAEIGIATGRLHARGPVGVDQLTSFQYHVQGKGQTRP